MYLTMLCMAASLVAAIVYHDIAFFEKASAIIASLFAGTIIGHLLQRQGGATKHKRQAGSRKNEAARPNEQATKTKRQTTKTEKRTLKTKKRATKTKNRTLRPLNKQPKETPR